MTYLRDLKKNLIWLIHTGVIIFGLTSPAWAGVSIVKPSTLPLQGEAFILVVEATGTQPKNGTLFYRPKGVRQYQHLPLTITKKKSAVATIPASAVIAPGIEYYVEIFDTTGKSVTSPTTYPKYNPHQLNVLPMPPPPEFKLISPDPGKSFNQEKLSIIIETTSQTVPLLANTATILLDSTDITHLASFSKNRIVFSTVLLPEPGKHSIRLATTDSKGKTNEKSWLFEVSDKPKSEKTRQLYARGNLSFNYGMDIKKDSDDDDKMSGNLGLSFGAKGKDWEVTWDGININYVKDRPEDEVTISSGFHFTATKKEQFLEYGDISINETPLTAPSLARRGVQAKLKGFGSELHLFDVGAVTVSGWDSGLEDDKNQIYGVSFQRAFLPNSGLPISLVCISGENQAVNGFNTAGADPPSKGDVYGVTLGHSLLGIKFDLEFAGSSFDDNTDDDLKEETDSAGTANLSTSVGKISLGTGYHYYGPDFTSIANPNFTTDREGYSANIGTALGPSSLSLSGSQNRDNVDKDDTRPVVTSTSGTLSYGVAVAPWPSLNLSYSTALQKSDDEPDGAQKTDNTNDSISMNLSKSGKTWTTSLGGNFGKIKDKISDLDSDTLGYQFSYGYSLGEVLSLSPSFSYSESESYGITKDTSIFSYTTNISLWKSLADLSFQGAYTTNGASDDSVDSTNLNGAWRFSLNIEQIIKKWIKYGGQQSLSLSINYNELEDNLNDANSYKSVSIYLSINFLSFSKPIEWGWDF